MKKLCNLAIRAATDIIKESFSAPEMDERALEWEISEEVNRFSKATRGLDWIRLAVGENRPQVVTKSGMVGLDWAIIELALKTKPSDRTKDAWTEMVAGLRFDGFEVEEADNGAPTLKAMLPEEIPGLDMREADDEITDLLEKHGFKVTLGHLTIAKSTFQRGEWTAANGELRKIVVGLLDEIAEKLGCDSKIDSKGKRDYLGKHNTPFLLADYNEWSERSQKPQYVQGLVSRMHPHGGHSGLSDEEDATFRLQITLVTARLFLRRYDKRVG